MNNAVDKSLESWIWDAACSIRGAQEAPKFKDFILPLIFTKRLCDVFDDELNRIAEQVGWRAKAFKLVERDHKLVRFYLPLRPQDSGDAVWSVIRKLTGKIGERLTTYLRDIAKANPTLEGIIDRMDFNATTHGQRDIDDDRLSNLIERISEKRLGLKDVEADIIGRSYEYLIRKFAEGSGQSAGEFFTPPEVARPAALSAKVDAETAARGEQIREHFTAQLRKSTAPSAVAEMVIKGIADEQFYIFTDQDWDLDIRRRFEHILARQDPPLGSTAYQESER